MPLPTIPSGNVNSGLATGYDVANSCRFDRGSSASMHITFSGAGDRQKFTFSFWVKRNKLGTQEVIFDTNFGGGANEHRILFDSSDRLEYYDYSSTTNNLKYVTNRLFRDTTAWYSIIIAVDTTQGTAGNRVKIYINGTQETSFGTETQPSENLTTQLNTGVKHQIGVKNVSSNYLDAYLAEFVFISGTQYAASDFGEFDSDSPRIWKPKDVSGLTFGTNGFYLDFEDSSNLGNDANGGTDLTEVNLAATDQAQDSPTNNWAVLNPLDHYYNATTSTGGTLSEGSTLFVIASGNKGFARSSIGVTAGKWYWECKLHAVSKGFLGVCNNDILIQDSTPQVNAIYLYEATPDFRSGDQILTTGVASISTNDIMNFALDMENHAFYIGVNNSWMNSGDPTSGDSRTGAISELFTTGRAIIRDSGAMFANLLNTSTSGGINTSMNFGCPPYANSSDAADANGFGAFEFSPPAGYLALCTKNLGSDGG